MPNELYSLGLEDRDRVNPNLGGGIPTGSIVLLEGEHGAGKSVITQRMAYGLCETDNNVTYVSTELTSADFVNQMDSLNYDITGHLLDENILFLHGDVDTQKRILGDGPERPLLTRLMQANTMWNSDVIIFDGFASILLHDPRYEEIKGQGDADDVVQNLISFFRQIVANGRTIILTVNPTSLSEPALRPMRDASDVYMYLEMNTVGNDVRRNMLIKKFAGMGSQVEDNVGYAVESDRGLGIVNRTVA